VSTDKLTYAFTLRDGLKWHDGQPVTAEDCVASITRWAARDTIGQKLMTFVLAIAAKDARTIEIRLKEPTAHLRPALGKPNSNVPFMMPRRHARPSSGHQRAAVRRDRLHRAPPFDLYGLLKADRNVQLLTLSPVGWTACWSRISTRPQRS
jgi:hypothetical protein